MSSSKNIIKLNIGGTIFQTSHSTLTKYDGMFRVMLESGVPSETDESGCIFIDRDPKHFRLILNFMRDSEVELPRDPREIQEILKEAEFYLLEELIKLCDRTKEEKVISPDYHVIKDTEDLMDFVMKAEKDVLVIFFPNKTNTLYYFDREILQKFIEKHKETVEIVFCRKENSLTMTPGWLFNYYRLESELNGIYTQNELQMLQDVREMIKRLETARKSPILA